MDNATIKRRLFSCRDEVKMLQEEIYSAIDDEANDDRRGTALDNLQGELRDVWQGLDDMIENLTDMADEGDGVEEENEDELEEAEPEK